MKITLSRVAEIVAGEIKGDPAKIVRGAIKKIYLGADPATVDTSSIEVPEFLHAITKAV